MTADGRPPMTARARARAEITEQIKALARQQLAEVGAPGLSLRAVARDLGMVSSAVYRYFPSRDDLLTALLIESFDAVGEVAEAAYTASSGPLVERWLALAEAVRAWAVAHPHDWALAYGSPVPGYVAPQDTAPPAARVSLVALRLVADGLDAGEIDPTPTEAVPPPVARDLARLRDEHAPGVPDEVLARALLVWTAMFGLIGYGLFGHLEQVIVDQDAFFRHEMRRAATLLAGPVAG